MSLLISNSPAVIVALHHELCPNCGEQAELITECVECAAQMCERCSASKVLCEVCDVDLADDLDGCDTDRRHAQGWLIIPG